MQVLDKIREKGTITKDEQLILDNYPSLMQCYDQELREVYRVAEESCCRILANSYVPNLRDIESDSTDSTAANLTEAFFDAIDCLQATGTPRRDQVPQSSAAKFKKWYERYKHKPGEEALIQLCMETGVSIKVVCGWTSHSNIIEA